MFNPFLKNIFKYYIVAVAVAALSLQHFLAAASLEQQVFAFAHFFLFFLPPSANAAPVNKIAAVANKNTFFICINFNCCLIISNVNIYNKTILFI